MSSTTAFASEESPGKEGRLSSDALLAALRAFRDGDFAVRLPSHLSGVDGEIAQAFNECIQHNAELSNELARVSDVTSPLSSRAYRGKRL
jgi:hypothetical protein